MFTIILAIACGILLIALGIMIYLFIMIRQDEAWAREDLEVAEEAISNLRSTNRSSLKVWQSERQRLQAQARSAERHARDLQEFHLRTEFELQYKLAGANAVIELLMETLPEEHAITPVPQEVARIFASVIELDQHRPGIPRNDIF